MKLLFLGAARQVTGSCYLLEAGGLRVLIDCGLFQERHYVERNWAPFAVDPGSIDYLLMTHAHLDHSGLIPRLVQAGFSRPILTTAASKDLAEIILEDAARIQEEDAAFKAKRHRREGRRGPFPEEALYTARDATAALPLFRKTPYGKEIKLNDHVGVTFHDAGHILGSAMLEIRVREKGEARTILFSGDLGQQDKPIIRDPTLLDRADYVVMESTYGDRDHADGGSVEDQLGDVVNAAVDAGGNIVIPTFAIERAQELMYYVARLVRADRIPHLMVFLDSPMAVDATEVFRKHRDCMDDEAKKLMDAGEPLFEFPGLKLVRSTHDSKAINRIRGSCIIMAGSGMCTAGRVKHHLVRNISRPESTVVFVGYQAGGTLGRQIVDDDRVVRIHGAEYVVRAKVAQIHGLSAHADRTGLLRWIGALKAAPRRVFLTHGEVEAAEAFAGAIRSRWNCAVEVPAYRAEFELD